MDLSELWAGHLCHHRVHFRVARAYPCSAMNAADVSPVARRHWPVCLKVSPLIGSCE